MRTNKFTTFIFLLIIIAISIPIILPYFKPGFFPTHDGEWAVVRLGDMFRTLRDFQFPPRYSGALNFGYGYPLFNFAYPLPYYIGIIMYLPLRSYILSIKSIFILSVFLSGVFMYYASYQLWKDRVASLVASILYLYLPYRIVDLFVRGSIGESMSFALFPLIFYFSLKLFESPFGRITVVLLSFSIASLVMTHNIMTILFMPLLIAFISAKIIIERRTDVAQSFFLSIFIGAGLSSFFWFPALFEKGLITLSKIPIADRSLYFVNFKQLIIPSWGYLPPTDPNGFSYQLGIAQVLVILSTILILIFFIFKKRMSFTPVKKTAIILSIIYLIYFTMMFSVTSPIWKIVPLLKEINYPWTILSQLGFIAALLAGFVVIQGKYLRYFGLLLALIAIVLNFGYLKPEKYNSNSDTYYLTNEATTTSSDELMPVWVSAKPTSHYKDKVQVISGNATISDLEFNSKLLKFKFDSTNDPIFQINTIYYPGWRAYLNGTEVKIRHDNPQGVMVIEGNNNSNSVFLNFTETLPRTIANGVSILFVILLLFILLRPILLFNNEN